MTLEEAVSEMLSEVDRGNIDVRVLTDDADRAWTRLVEIAGEELGGDRV